MLQIKRNSNSLFDTLYSINTFCVQIIKRKERSSKHFLTRIQNNFGFFSVYLQTINTLSLRATLLKLSIMLLEISAEAENNTLKENDTPLHLVVTPRLVFSADAHP